MSHASQTRLAIDRRRPGAMHLRPGRVASVLGLAVASLAAPVGAQGAAPGNVEVVSRAWGVAGAAPYSLGPNAYATLVTSGVVSDDGRWVAFSASRDGRPLPTTAPDPAGPRFDVPLYLRDVRNNRTVEISSDGAALATGISRNGRYISYVKATGPAGTTSTPSGRSDLYVYDTLTGFSSLVSRAGLFGGAAGQANGLISGNGRSVVFSTTNLPGKGPGIYRRILLTGATVKLADLPESTLPDGPFITSASDDASRVAYTTFELDNPVNGTILAPGRVTRVAGVPRVNADGTTAAFLRRNASGTAAELVVVDPSTGSETVAPALPVSGGIAFGYSSSAVGWISPDGQEIGVAPRADASLFPSPPVPAQILDRRSGQWRTAGPFAEALTEPLYGVLRIGAAVISRNGRFGLIPTNRQAEEQRALLVVDAWGQNGLPGGADKPPAVLYFERSAVQCPAGPSIVRIRARTAPKYLPKAKSVRGVVKVNGQLAFDETVTTDESGDVTLPEGPATLSVAATVTFEDGTTASGTYALPVGPERCNG